MATNHDEKTRSGKAASRSSVSTGKGKDGMQPAGSFKNDPERAAQAGRKGGEASHGTSTGSAERSEKGRMARGDSDQDLEARGASTDENGEVDEDLDRDDEDLETARQDEQGERGMSRGESLRREH